MGNEKQKDTLLYIIPFENSGFTIISGEYSAPPILGYCPEGEYDITKMPPGLLYLIEKYKYGINKLKISKKNPTEKINKLWQEYLGNNQLKSYSIGYNLIHSEWSQYDSFNDLCPEDCPAGCTAVAMAQILKYWECRISPSGSRTYSDGWTIVDGNYYGASANFGSTTYNWDNMNDIYAVSENKKLIFHAGVSCQTHYTTSNGSSSTPNRARDAFVTYWGISSDADVRSRSMHLITWEDDLKDELNLERPILYSASGLVGGGHSWVIDGYTEQNKFLCNWGFGGDYNGPYSLGDFDLPGEYGPYNQYESAIFNVYPNQPTGVATPVLANQSFTYNPAGYTITIPPAFGATDYQWTTNKGTITGTGTSVTLNANSTATVQVRAKNSRCNIYSPFKSATITINYGPISAPNIICYSGAAASIQNVPNATITWGGTNVSYPYGNTGTSVTVRATSTSTAAPGTITAIFTVDGAQRTVSKTIWAGKPVISTISGPQYLPYGGNQIYTASVNGAEGATYQWSVYPSLPLTSYGDNVQITFPSTNGDYTITLVVTGCGQSAPYYYYVSTGEYEPNIVFPNPASGETTLSIASVIQAKDTDEKQEWEYEVYTQNQLLKDKKTKLTGSSTTIDTHGWQEGVYIVRVKYGKEIMQGKLVVKR